MSYFLDPGWLGLGITVISILLAVYFYRQSRRDLEPVYVIKTFRLLGHSPELPTPVEIRYAGALVPQLTRAVVTFWNNGRSTIRKTDLIARDPLRIVFPEDARILRTEILKCSNAVNNVTATSAENSKEVILDFDFLEPQDGAVLEILHTGTDAHPKICGTIIGAHNGIRNLSRNPKYRSSIVRISRLTRRFYLGFGLAAMVFGAGISAISIYLVTTKNEALLSCIACGNSVHEKAISGAILGVTYLALGGYTLLRHRQKMPKSLRTPLTVDADAAA